MDTKLDKFLAKTQHPQRKWLNVALNWHSHKVTKSAKIWFSKSIFSIGPNHFFWHFLLLTFFCNFNFWYPLFSKMMPNFWWLATILWGRVVSACYALNWAPPKINAWLSYWDLKPKQCQLSKFNNFLWVWWFFTKNLSNFVYLPRKLDKPYCHTH